MSCKIIYNNQNYTIESFKDFLVTNKNLFLQDFISQDIEGFKDFVRAEEAQEEYIREKEKESQERLNDFYMGDFALREQELRDLEEFRNNNSNMPDEDIDDYFLSCKL